MTLARRSRSPIGAVAVAPLLTGTLGVPVSGLSDDHEAAAEVVLLANDGVLPLDPDLSLAVITAEPAQPADTSLAELGADLVLETGYDTAPGRYAGSLTVTIFPTEAD